MKKADGTYRWLAATANHRPDTRITGTGPIRVSRTASQAMDLETRPSRAS
jgi:hypothetical protein